MQPLVSVIVPTYKREFSILRRALLSLKNQTYKNIEVILIDDNGRDDLTQYRRQVNDILDLDEFSELNIKYLINTSNIGGAASRNKGIENAKGEYITFLDDDDEFRPQKIEKQLSFMINNDLDFSFTDLTIYNENKELIDVRSRSDLTNCEKDTLLKYHLLFNITGTETFMGKTHVFRQINGFDDVKAGHEFYLFLKILNVEAIKIGYMSGSDIIAYRSSGECISNGPNKIPTENIIYNLRKKYFDQLTSKEIRFIKCRHRAVIATVYKRQRKYIKSFAYLVFTFLTSPTISITEYLGIKKRIKKYKNL